MANMPGMGGKFYVVAAAAGMLHNTDTNRETRCCKKHKMQAEMSTWYTHVQQEKMACPKPTVPKKPITGEGQRVEGGEAHYIAAGRRIWNWGVYR